MLLYQYINKTMKQSLDMQLQKNILYHSNLINNITQQEKLQEPWLNIIMLYMIWKDAETIWLSFSNSRNVIMLSLQTNNQDCHERVVIILSFTKYAAWLPALDIFLSKLMIYSKFIMAATEYLSHELIITQTRVITNPA